jgi:hypothetical protein
MPLPLELTWSDGAIETFMLPAEIWKRNPEVFSKLFVSDRSLVSVRLDPQRRIADADRTNNVYPSEVVAGRFGIDASSRRDRGSNPMRDQREELVRKATGDTAFAIARQQRAAWARIEDADRPIDRASELISSSDESKLDGWGRPFGHTYGELGLDKDGADQLLFIELVSAGADGEVGTSDDVAFWMNLMGEFHEGPYIRTVAGD